MISVVVLINSVATSKTNDILNSKKLPQKRSESIEDLELLKNRIFEKSENSILVFYADWCPHCKDFLPVFDNASEYEISKNFNFFKINCQHKTVCNFFGINRYPTIKVYYKGKELDEEPGRDVEGLLHFVNKLSSPSIIQINSEEELKKFNVNLWESSFVMIYDDKNSEFYKCVENLVENKYKILFLIGAIQSENYKGKNYEVPSLIFNEKFSIFKKWTDKSSCEDIKNFFEDNKFPLIRKLDSYYIKRLQKENKTMIMTAVNSRNSIHMNIVENILPAVSVQNRNFVFTYIDIEQDAYLVSYFKINTNQLPKIIVYDFADKKFYVDDGAIYDKENSSEEAIIANINNILNNVRNDKVIWSTGNWFEDLLLKFGIKFNQHTIMYILAGCFGLIVIIMVIIIFYCGEKPDGEGEQTEKFIQEIKNKIKAEGAEASDNLVKEDSKQEESKEKVSPTEKKNQ